MNHRQMRGYGDTATIGSNVAVVAVAPAALPISAADPTRIPIVGGNPDTVGMSIFGSPISYDDAINPATFAVHGSRSIAVPQGEQRGLFGYGAAPVTTRPAQGFRPVLRLSGAAAPVATRPVLRLAAPAPAQGTATPAPGGYRPVLRLGAPAATRPDMRLAGPAPVVAPAAQPLHAPMAQTGYDSVYQSGIFGDRYGVFGPMCSQGTAPSQQQLDASNAAAQVAAHTAAGHEYLGGGSRSIPLPPGMVGIFGPGRQKRPAAAPAATHGFGFGSPDGLGRWR